MKLRLATCAALTEPDSEDRFLAEALVAQGVRARIAAWNDPKEPWGDAVPTVIRSTWDYIDNRSAFLQWVERASRAAPLWNPSAIITWNSHKSYLVELASQGCPVVPTTVVARDRTCNLGALFARHPTLVVKPAVSGSSRKTLRFHARQRAEAERHLSEIVRDGDALIQPYLSSVEGYGERSLVWIDGVLTHAVRRTPRFMGDERSGGEPQPIADDERALVELILPRFDGLLYARIDLVRDDSGRPAVMELELIEPYLFLSHSPDGGTRLASAIAARVRRIH